MIKTIIFDFGGAFFNLNKEAQNELDLNESLFIDDTDKYIESARKLGFNTWNIQSEKENITTLYKEKQPLF